MRPLAGHSSPRMSRILNDLGVTLKHQGRYREAALALEQALILVEAKGEAPPDALAARLINLAEVNAAAGREAVRGGLARLGHGSRGRLLHLPR